MSPWKKMGIELLEKKIPVFSKWRQLKKSSDSSLLLPFEMKSSIQFCHKSTLFSAVFFKDAWEKARNKLAKCDPKQILLLKHFLFQDLDEVSFFPWFLPFQMLLLTAEFDQILGFPPWFYALCWDLRFWNCILTAFKFLEVFPFCWNMNEGITTHEVFFYNRISREFKSATTLQRLICHSNTTLMFQTLSRRRLTPFFR